MFLPGQTAPSMAPDPKRATVDEAPPPDADGRDAGASVKDSPDSDEIPPEEIDELAVEELLAFAQLEELDKKREEGDGAKPKQAPKNGFLKIPEPGGVLQMPAPGDDRLPPAPGDDGRGDERPAPLGGDGRAPEAGDRNIEGRDDDQGLRPAGPEEALLLYALYRAARHAMRPGTEPSSAGIIFNDAIRKVKDAVRYYTGQVPPYARLLPPENEMRLALDKQDRPVWAEISEGKNAGQRIIFDWQADGRLSVDFENRDGFKGRIESRGKIEISGDKLSMKSTDGTWVVTYPDGTVKQWQGELTLKPGASSFEWKPGFGERDHPLQVVNEHLDRSRQDAAMRVRALEHMTLSPEAQRAFTFREREHLKGMYGALMDGDANRLSRAFAEMCNEVTSPARRRQLMNHFAEASGLGSKLAFTEDAEGPRLRYTSPWRQELEINAKKGGTLTANVLSVLSKPVPPVDVMLDLVRDERAAREKVVAGLDARAQGKEKELAQTELAKALVLDGIKWKSRLSPSEKEALFEMERAFLDGDMKRFSRVIERYDTTPGALEKVMEEFTRDMKGILPGFEGQYEVASNAGRERGTYTLGNGEGTVRITTERGSMPVTIHDARLAEPRRTEVIFSELSSELVEKAKSSLPPEAQFVPRPRMTGYPDANGMFIPDYMRVLDENQRRELREKMAREYSLGNPNHMQAFVDRAGQALSGWQASHDELSRRLTVEERAKAELDRARQAHAEVKDAVLRHIGLTFIPADKTITQLQTSSTAVAQFLQSEEAKKAGIENIAEKVQTVDDYQEARSKHYEAWTERENAAARYVSTETEVLDALKGRTLPDGLTIEQLKGNADLLKQYLNHADATRAGITDLAEKIKTVEAHMQADQELERIRTEVFEPAEKRFETVRNEVLSRLGADKLPSGMTDVDLKTSAAMLERFLRTEGASWRIRGLEEKLAILEDYQEKQKTYDEAKAKTDEIVDQRRKSLEAASNELAKDVFKIPPSDLVVADELKKAQGDYLNGRIRYDRNYFLHATAADQIGTLYHEIVHAEQQYKVLHLYADNFERANGRAPTAAELSRAWEANQESTGIPLDYAERVLAARDGRQLSETEREVAEKLAESWKRVDRVTSDFDRSYYEYNKGVKLMQDLSERGGQRTAEMILDSYIRSKTPSDLVPELPGAEFESAEGKKTSRAMLEELVRDRVAYLNGETRQWDAEKARQGLLAVMRGRQAQVNEWRESHWGAYGGPDVKHEYDAQITGLVLEERASSHFNRTTGLRSLIEMVRWQKAPAVLKDELPLDLKKESGERGSTFFRFDRTEKMTMRTQNGLVEVLGVKTDGRDVSVVTRTQDGRIVDNKTLADHAFDFLEFENTQMKEFKDVAGDPLKKAELISRYFLHTSPRQLDVMARTSEAGSDKHGVVPRFLRKENPTFRDIQEYLERQIAGDAPNRETLIIRELRSLEATGNSQVRAAINEYKESMRERMPQAAESFFRSLAAGEVLLDVPISEQVARFREVYNAQSEYYGKPPEFDKTNAVLASFNQRPARRFALLKAENAKEPSFNKDFWENTAPRALDIESLERKRIAVIEQMTEQGINTDAIAKDRKFSLPRLENALSLLGKESAVDVVGSEGVHGSLLPQDLQRTALRVAGLDPQLASAEKLEKVIGQARVAIARGQVKSHKDLERFVAARYLEQALSGNGAAAFDISGQPSDARESGSAPKNTDTGAFGNEESHLFSKDGRYRARAEALTEGSGGHTMTATIDGKEVSLTRTLKINDRMGETSLALRPPRDAETLSLVEKRKEALFSEIIELSKEAATPENARSIVRRAAELEWLSAQTADQWNGSHDLTQAKLRALLDAAGIETGKYKIDVDPTMEALTTPLSEFLTRYEGFFETPPRRYSSDYQSDNPFVRALAGARGNPAIGKTEADGSTFYEFESPRKITAAGREYTVHGVRVVDGRPVVICRDNRGRLYEESRLTESHLRTMERALSSRPFALAGLGNSPEVKADILARVISQSSDADIERRVSEYESTKLRARNNFLVAAYYQPGMPTQDWQNIEKLKQALVDGQFSDFRSTVAGLDTNNKTPLNPGDAPATEFERVMKTLKEETRLAGVDAVDYEIKPDGTGVVRLTRGDTVITLDTKDAGNYGVTRNGEVVRWNAGWEAFTTLGNEVLAGHDRSISGIAPEVGAVLTVPDSNWQRNRMRVMTNDPAYIVVKNLDATGNGAQKGRATGAAISQDKVIREADLSDKSRYLEFTDADKPGKRLVLDKKYSKVYEIGERNALTWSLDLHERPEYGVLERETYNLWEGRQYLARQIEGKNPSFFKGDEVVLPERLGARHGAVIGKTGDRLIVQGTREPIFALEAQTPVPSEVSKAIADMGNRIPVDSRVEIPGFTDITREMTGQIRENSRILLGQDGKIYHVGVNGGNIQFVHDALSTVVEPGEVSKVSKPSRLFAPSNARSNAPSSPAGSESAPPVSPNSPTFSKGAAPGLKPSSPEGPIKLASGAGGFADTEGGGFRVEGRLPAMRAADIRTEDLPREEIARLREEILRDRENRYTPEEKVQALKSLELAESGHPEARQAVRGAMREAKGRGGFAVDRAAGVYVGTGLVVVALAGWYASHLESTARQPYVPRARVN